MSFSEEEINEFKVEAEDLLDQAEKSLLALDKGGVFKEHYDAIFRAFHSIKGAAGMMEMTVLQKHMHLLENTLTEQKSKDVLPKEYIDLFLRGADGARSILEGKEINFDYGFISSEVKAPVAAPSAAVQVKSTEPVSERPMTNTCNGKVLVVDDEPEIVELLKLILVDAGFEVLGVTDPEKVVDQMKTFKPNAVLSDISMPKLNGLELLGKIVAHDPDVPVVFISGNVTKDTLVDAIKMGVFGVIEKPFHVGRVIEAASQAVGSHLLNRMVNEGINLLMYQFSDLDQYLKLQGKEDVRRLISSEIQSLVEQRKKIRESRKVRA